MHFRCAPERFFPSDLQPRWRAMPDHLIPEFVSSGCAPWNSTCLGLSLSSVSVVPLIAALHFSYLLLACRLQTAVTSIANGSPFPAYSGPAAEYAKSHWSPHDLFLATRRWHALAGLAMNGQAPAASQVLAEAYGNRFMLFVATNSTSSVASAVVVLEAAPIGCLGGTALETSLDVEISLLGPAQTLSVTPNGQHFFSSTGRFFWQLQSMTRLADVCSQLAINPSDVFLQNFTAVCNPSDDALIPRPPVISDFLLVRVPSDPAFVPVCFIASPSCATGC